MKVPTDTPFEITARYRRRSAKKAATIVTIKDQVPPPPPPPTQEEKMVIDPITRIEGHLRIETKVVDGSVQSASGVSTLSSWTVHSLDPCIACAVHVIDPQENEVYTVRGV